MTTHYFLGIHVPSQVAVHLQTKAEAIRTRCEYRKWTAIADYHLTLFFFGALTKQQVEKFNGIFSDAAAQASVFTLELTHIDGFGASDHPRIVYAGIKHSQALFDLREKLNQTLAKETITLDSRPFHPHVTLAKRWQSGNPRIGGQSDQGQLEALSWSVREMTLFTVHPDRIPNYQPAAKFAFQT